jgi:hypothetical protein
MKYVDLNISQEMLDYAASVQDLIKVNRTRASEIDTLTGAIGELAFAAWFLGDWRLHDLTTTKGRVDFLGAIEVKTSAFPFSDRLNLLVRSDYAVVRAPKIYVQTIVNVSDRRASQISPGMTCRLSGWATHEEVLAAPLKDFGSKFGGRGGYSCHHIQIRYLHPMSAFPIDRG